MRFLVALLLSGAVLYGSEGAGIIEDEGIRMEALRVIFPGLTVHYLPGETIDSTRPVSVNQHPLVFPDAFAPEKVYRVSGPPSLQPEYCAAAIQGPDKATSRELRFQLYPWPGGGGTELLAILQYRFPDAAPPAFCTSVGLLAHLAPVRGFDELLRPLALEPVPRSHPAGGAETSEHKDAALRLLEAFALDGWRHTSIQSVRMVDVTGDGRSELLVESDARRTSADSSELYVFDLNGGRFDLMLREYARVYTETPRLELWHQTLDVARTLRECGKRFCFERTTDADRDKRLPTPRITHPCYPRGRGVRPE